MAEKVEYISLSDIKSILFGTEKLSFSGSVLNRVKTSYDFLYNFSKDRVIYGINTGFGPMAQYRVSDDEREQLQYNIIRSHSAGAGNPLPVPDRFPGCQ